MHALKHNPLVRVLTIMLLLIAVMAFAIGCGVSASDGGSSDTKTRDNGYAQLVTKQPAHGMSYSPTRDTINFYVDTWGHDPGKLSYVYLQNSSGTIIGYYVFKGLPVTMCAALTPTQREVLDQGDGNGGNVVMQAPSLDGVYYSGGQCSEYYGKDATSGAFVDYTVGLGINTLLYDQPLPPQEVGGAPHLGPTSVNDVRKH